VGIYSLRELLLNELSHDINHSLNGAINITGWLIILTRLVHILHFGESDSKLIWIHDMYE